MPLNICSRKMKIISLRLPSLMNWLRMEKLSTFKCASTDLRGLEEQKSKLDEMASMSTYFPRPFKQLNLLRRRNLSRKRGFMRRLNWQIFGQPTSYDGLWDHIIHRVWGLDHEYLEAGEEAKIADVHPEPIQLQDCPKDQEELIEFNLTEEKKEAQPIFISIFVCWFEAKLIDLFR